MDPTDPYGGPRRIVHRHVTYHPRLILFAFLLFAVNVYVLLAIINMAPECRINLGWHLANPSLDFLPWR